MKYTVKNIYEADFGCEERIDDNGLKVIVYLEDECGKITKVEQLDSYLIENSINEGSIVRIDTRGMLILFE